MNQWVTYLQDSLRISALPDLLHEFTTREVLRGHWGLLGSNFVKLKHLQLELKRTYLYSPARLLHL